VRLFAFYGASAAAGNEPLTSQPLRTPPYADTKTPGQSAAAPSAQLQQPRTANQVTELLARSSPDHGRSQVKAARPVAYDSGLEEALPATIANSRRSVLLADLPGIDQAERRARAAGRCHPVPPVLQRPEVRHDLERGDTCDTALAWDTGGMAEISVRIPLLGRIWVVVFCAGLSAAMINASVRDYLHGKTGRAAAFWVTIPVGLLAILAASLATMSFRADASDLVIRNYLVARRTPSRTFAVSMSDRCLTLRIRTFASSPVPAPLSDPHLSLHYPTLDPYQALAEHGPHRR
jgi:hypothetical protein